MSAILSNVNYLAVVAAAVAGWLFGAVYYGMLGKQWIAAQGKTMAAFKQEQAAKVGSLSGQVPFIVAFVSELAMAFVLFGILTHMGLFSVRAGIISGAFCWFGFVLPVIAVNNAFTGRSTMLTVIDAGHWLGVLLIIGAVLGAFGK